jgi:hypothetical protein
MTELNATLGQAFPEPEPTGRVYHDEPVDYYPQPNRELPEGSDDGFSSSSDDDDVSDACPNLAEGYDWTDDDNPFRVGE